jgi:hypothetical protein
VQGADAIDRESIVVKVLEAVSELPIAS